MCTCEHSYEIMPGGGGCAPLRWGPGARGGAAYPDSDNIRMHVYLYAEGIERPGKGTWRVPEFVPTREVQWHSKERPLV